MMTQRILAGFVFILAGMSWVVPATAQDEDTESWKRTTWQIGISLDTSGLVPSAVQWAVFDQDPVPAFEARVKSMQGYYGRRVERAEDQAKKELARTSQMTVSWDLGFKKVTGDRVYLLVSAPSVSNGFSSNSPDGKKWIVTKTVRVKGKPVCWCIPVTVETGRTIQITLSADNMFDLESAFDKAMRGSISDKK